MEETLERVFTVQDAAEHLQTRREQVYRWIEQGKLKSVRPFPGGKRHRIRQSDLKDFIARMK